MGREAFVQVLVQVPEPGEVPVELQAAEVEGDAPAVGRDRVLEPVLLAVPEIEVLDLVVPGAADVEEDTPPDANASIRGKRYSRLVKKARSPTMVRKPTPRRSSRPPK